MASLFNMQGTGLSGRSLGWIAGGIALAAATVALFSRRANGPLSGGMRTLTSGDAFEVLIQGHQRMMDLFQQIIDTEESDTLRRGQLLAQLKYEILAHALAEEDIVYPAMRQYAQFRGDANELFTEHAEIKTYLFELEEMAKDDPNWISRLIEFRNFIAEHAHEEEQNIFPKYRAMLNDEQLDHLTSLVKREEMMARL